MEIDVNGLMKKGINLNLGKQDIIELMVGELQEGTEQALAAVVEEQESAANALIRKCQQYYRDTLAEISKQSDVLDLIASLDVFYKGQKSYRLVVVNPDAAGRTVDEWEPGLVIVDTEQLAKADATIVSYPEDTILYQYNNGGHCYAGYESPNPPIFRSLNMAYARFRPLEHSTESMPQARCYLPVGKRLPTSSKVLKQDLDSFVVGEQERLNKYHALMRQYHDLNKSNGGKARLAIIRALASATEEGKQLIKVLEARTAQTGIKKLAKAAQSPAKAKTKTKK